MLILEFFSYMSVDYTRKHQWTITPKGSRYRKTYIVLHDILQRSQRKRFRCMERELEVWREQHRHDSRGSDGHRGSMSIMTSVLHQSDTLFQRGRDSSNAGRESNQRLRNTEKDQRNLDKGRSPKDSADRGSIPKKSLVKGEHPQGEIPFSIDVKGGEIETLMRSMSMNVIMTKCFHQCWCFHQCQRGILSDNWFRLMESWFGLLVVIDVNPWRVIL
jgi:hypothetical protein